MKLIVAASLIVAAFADPDPTRIARINKLKAAAAAAYRSGDYKTAAAAYQYLVDSLRVSESEALLNLANAYFNAADPAKAALFYERVAQSNAPPDIASAAHQQLGVLANRKSRFEEALNDFKKALQSNPSNQQARYNYELLSRKLKDKKNQQQQKPDQGDKQKQDQQNKQNQNKNNQGGGQDQNDQNKPQPGGDEKKQSQQQTKDNTSGQPKRNHQGDNKQDKGREDEQKKGQENKGQPNEGKDQKNNPQPDKQGATPQRPQGGDSQNAPRDNISPAVAERLRQMNISEEKARMLLDAMRNREAQYLQQQRRKSVKPKDNRKPDW